jgi:RES domain-containing protein
LTPDDLQLDPAILLTQQPLTLYRLARKRYANLSGAGAAAFPGRWNRAGQEAIYTSIEVGVPVLERLVHTPKDIIPSNLALMRMRVAGAGEHGLDYQTGGSIVFYEGGCIVFYKSIREARDAFTDGPQSFAATMNPFAIAVPSVIVLAWNVILYPEGTGFWDHVSLESIEPFDFDPRLFPDDVQVESA